MKLGAQLYTVRDFTQDLEGLAASLKKIASIGYTTVQLSGTCPFEGEWLKEQLRQNGLSCVLTHVPAAELQTDTDKVIAKHKRFGCAYIGLGYYAFNEDSNEGYRRFGELYRPVAQQIQSNGLYFMYHNHDQEFDRRDGKLIIERLAEDFPKALMGFTLDTFWVQAGGADPARWIERLSGRVPCIHLKDFAYGRKMAVVGEGNINFERVFEKAESSGTAYMLVEQDDCNGEDPFDCLRRSYQYLKSMGFA